MTEKSVAFKSNIINVTKPVVSFCGCQASNREVDTDDLNDFVKEVTACDADVSELYKLRHSFTLSEGLTVNLIY